MGLATVNLLIVPIVGKATDLTGKAEGERVFISTDAVTAGNSSLRFCQR